MNLKEYNEKVIEWYNKAIEGLTEEEITAYDKRQAEVLQEELKELSDAIMNDDIVEILDGVCDSLWCQFTVVHINAKNNTLQENIANKTLINNATAFIIDEGIKQGGITLEIIEDCLDEVCKSNFSKMIDGKLIRDETGKITKQPAKDAGTYYEPDIAKVLEKYDTEVIEDDDNHLSAIAYTYRINRESNQLEMVAMCSNGECKYLIGQDSDDELNGIPNLTCIHPTIKEVIRTDKTTVIIPELRVCESVFSYLTLLPVDVLDDVIPEKDIGMDELFPTNMYAKIVLYNRGGVYIEARVCEERNIRYENEGEGIYSIAVIRNFHDIVTINHVIGTIEEIAEAHIGIAAYIQGISDAKSDTVEELSAELEANEDIIKVISTLDISDTPHDVHPVCKTIQ